MNEEKQIVFVTDFTSEEVQGGAELTLDAIIAESPYQKIRVIKSDKISPELISKPNIHWIFGNYTRINKNVFEYILQNAQKLDYSIIEFDYKFCIARNDLVHNFEIYRNNNSFGFCNCHTQSIGKATEHFLKFAKKVHFMSQEQMNLIIKKLPELRNHVSKFRVQWSTWSKEHLNFIDSLYKEKEVKELNQIKWAVQQNDHWLKGKENALTTAKKHNLNLSVLPSKKYEDFLKELSDYDGLIFLPNAWDTCPRIVVEAKLLGLKTLLNNKVQIANDPIFMQSRESLKNYLENNSKEFWKQYQL